LDHRLNHKRLAQWSIAFVVLIFISQTYLIARLFGVNYTYLEKVVNSIAQDAYTKDINLRLHQNSSRPEPLLEIHKVGDASVDTTGGYVIDSMKGVDKSSLISIMNIATEMTLSQSYPIVLEKLDSLARILLTKENINTSFYTQIVDLDKDSIMNISKPEIRPKSNSWNIIQSKNIPLNFQQTKVLQLVVLNPLKTIFTQMAGMLVLSLLLCLFCIYCLYILQRTLARQKKLAQSKNDFYNQVSHELKKPVSVILQAIDSLTYPKTIDNPERRKRYLDISAIELDRMSSKIDMILTMSMVEEGMFELKQSVFDLREQMEEIRERYSLVSSKPVELIVNFTLTNTLIYADKDHLFQCLSNLTDNAIKYSGESVRIKYTFHEVNEWVYISVKDNGQGISHEDQERIFNKFERANKDKKAHGYGIGLSYVRQIAEMHGGSVSVQSEKEKGSEFILRIPKKH
jgi:two-component system, OmpR family, phosphate regulon sensor histidine kinase PhoR